MAFTKERLEQFINKPLEHGLTRGEQMELARQMLSNVEIIAVAEKLVRCRGRYHSEQNYRALAALFGVTTPDLPPLEDEQPVAVVEPSDYVTAAQLVGEGPARKAVHELYEGALRIGDKLYLHPQQGKAVQVPECFERLLHHAYGLTMGHDWNKGTMAGHHREKMCQAVEECRAAMLQGNHRDLSYPVDPQIAAYETIMEQAIPDGYALVPVEPTEDMVIHGFESVPHPLFQPADWDKYQTMSGCEQAAHRAKLCWAAMIAAAPQQEVKP